MQRAAALLRTCVAVIMAVTIDSETGVAFGQLPSETAAREAQIDGMNRQISELSRTLNGQTFRIRFVDVVRDGLKRAARAEVRQAIERLELDLSEDGLRRFCNSILVHAEAHVRPYAEARVIYSAEGMKEEVTFDLLPVRAPLPATRVTEVRSEIAGQVTTLQSEGLYSQASLYPAGGLRLGCGRGKVFLCTPIAKGVDIAAATGDGLVTLTQRGIQGHTKYCYSESLQYVMSREILWAGSSDVLAEQHMRGVAAVVGTVKIPRLSWRANYSDGQVSSLSVFLIEVLAAEERGEQTLAIRAEAGTTIVDFRRVAGTPHAAGPRFLGVLTSASDDVASQIASEAVNASDRDSRATKD